jgi:hypothetical protein
LPSIFMTERLTARMAAPARIKMSVSGSISAAAASRSSAGGRASFMSRASLLFVLPYHCRHVLAARGCAVYQTDKHA